MRLSHILLITLVAFVATTLGAPVSETEQDVPEQTTVAVDQSDDVADATEVPEEVTTIIPLSDDEAEDGSAREGRQLDEGDDEDDGDQDDEDDDDEDEDADEEEEEEEDRKRAGAKPVKGVSSKKKTPAPAKPVPHLDQGVEDDEAEDLGIYERDEPKSSDEAVADKASDEEADDEEGDDDEEGSDEDDDEDNDEPARSTGLIAEPVSSERGDVDDVIPQVPIAPVPSEIQPEQPLAIAVVQPEETADPVVPILVEDTVASSSNLDKKEKASNKKNGNKAEPQADDDDEDDDDEEGSEEDDEEGRSEKIHRARSEYPASPVLYYYPFPDAAAAPEY